MSSFNAGNPTPQMMVLALVIQQPDTAAGVARRLIDRFPSARFPGGSAYDNMPSLANKGFLRLVERNPAGQSSLDRYEATTEGIEYFRDWLLSSELPPLIRDALQFKLEFVERDDIAELVRLVRKQQEVYTAAYDVAHGRVLREQRLRRTKAKPVDVRARLEWIQHKDEAALWGMISKRLERLGDELEELLKDLALGEAA